MLEPKFFSASKLVDGFLLVLALTIILDVWAGYFGLLSGLIPLLAAGLAYFFFMKRHGFFSFIPEKISPIAWGAALLVAGGAGIILFGIQYGFDLSADVAPVFAAQQITNRIPLFYPPPINLLFFYPPGFPALVAQFSFLPIPLHQLAWGVGLLGLLLTFLYFPRVGELKKISMIGLALIPLFLLGARLPILSLLTGEYSLLLSVGLGMAAWAWFSRDSFLAALILGASFLTHPYGGLAILIAIILTQKIGKKEWLAFAATLLITLPMIFFQFVPYIQSDKLTIAAEKIHLGAGDIVAMFFLIGVVPLFFWIAGLFIRTFEKSSIKNGSIPHPLEQREPFSMVDTAAFRPLRKSFSFFRNQFLINETRRASLLLAGVGVMGYILGLQFPSFVFGTKLLLLATLGSVLGAAYEWSNLLNQKNWKWAGIIVVLASLTLLAASTDMHRLVNGSKITIEEAQFAQEIAGKIPPGSTVLFLSSSQGKMGEYSRTIPPDIFTTHYLTSVIWKNSASPNISRLLQEAEESKIILQEKCVSCLANYEGKYILVNTRMFPALVNYPVIYQNNGFILYENNPLFP